MCAHDLLPNQHVPYFASVIGVAWGSSRLKMFNMLLCFQMSMGPRRSLPRDGMSSRRRPTSSLHITAPYFFTPKYTIPAGKPITGMPVGTKIVTRVQTRTCYDCFFSLRLTLFLFTRLPHAVPPYYRKGVLITSVPVSPRTPISTDRFSRTDYVVPFTHHFHHVPSHSTLTRPFD